MNSRDFKKIFGEVANSHRFQRAFEGWFREFPELIQVLELQKSNYSNLFYLNVKFFVQGMFGNEYVKSKNLTKRDIGNISFRQPVTYNNVFDLESSLNPNERKDALIRMFDEYLSPLSAKACCRDGIITLNRTGELYILPAVKKELGI